jgi:hypothetical protein
MKWLTLTGLVAAAVLVWASGAQAKELASLKVCGASGCKEVKGEAFLRDAIGLAEIQGEPVTIRTPRPAPYFRLEFRVKGDEGSTPSFLQYYVPASRAVTWRVGEGAWGWIHAGARRPLYERAIAGVKPFARPAITRVTIGGKPAADPASYTRLFRLNRATSDYPDDSDWIRIELGSKRPSPWSTHASTIEYSPSEDILWRGTEFIKVPEAIAARLEARKSLAVGTESDSFPWLPLVGGLGGASLLVPLALTLRRRRIR